MAANPEEIQKKLLNELPAEHVEVEDISGGCGQSFKAIIVSNVFEGKPLLQRHRLVNECLKNELKEIHAFTQKTYTPEQWQNVQKK